MAIGLSHSLCAAAADPIRLFDSRGHAIRGYTSTVRKLGVDSVVRFGRTAHTLRKALGGGNSSIHFGIGRGRAIKLALSSDKIPLLNEFLEEYAVLEKLAPVVPVYERESIR